MTTLIALATKDSLIFGCDSLGSSTKKLIDPFKLTNFFDFQNGTFDIKLDANGKPLLKNFEDIFSKATDVPFTHMTHMSKLFSLDPLEMAVMMTGIASIKDRTVKSLIDEFKTKDIMFRIKPKPRNYSVQTIANKLLDFITVFYDDEFKDSNDKPSLELILGGYGKREALPEIYRIQFPDKKIIQAFDKGDFGIVMGGQVKEIQRLIFGSDPTNKWKIHIRQIETLREYRNHCNEILRNNNIDFSIPELQSKDIDAFKMFKDAWNLDGFEANWGDFSEQSAIEFVDFLVNIMIKSQEFCIGMPTVGGEVHIALINKQDGVKFISKEEYKHEGHIVPKKINKL